VQLGCGSLLMSPGKSRMSGHAGIRQVRSGPQLSLRIVTSESPDWPPSRAMVAAIAERWADVMLMASLVISSIL